MILEKDNKKYWTSAESFEELGAMSKAKLQASLIPYEEYLKNMEIVNLEKEIVYLEELPDEVLVPNEEKMRLPELQDRLKILKD